MEFEVEGSGSGVQGLGFGAGSGLRIWRLGWRGWRGFGFGVYLRRMPILPVTSYSRPEHSCGLKHMSYSMEFPVSGFRFPASSFRCPVSGLRFYFSVRPEHSCGLKRIEFEVSVLEFEVYVIEFEAYDIEIWMPILPVTSYSRPEHSCILLESLTCLKYML